MDANSKLGSHVIVNDPHKQSPNGKILEGILVRHALIVANSLSEKCIGSITRKRCTSLGVEESIVDFIIFSEDMEDFLVSLEIDETRKHVITKINYPIFQL